MENKQKKENKEQAKVVKGKQTRFGDRKLIAAVVSILCAFVIFIVFLTIENHIVNDVEATSVVVAITDVPKGIVLTEENMPSYFAMQMRTTGELPANTFTSGYELVGKVTKDVIVANQIVTANCVVQEDFYADIEDPVEISIEVGKIGQAVGGILRAGDKVDINLVVDVAKQEEIVEEEELEGVALTDVPEISVMDGIEEEDSFIEETPVDDEEQEEAINETQEVTVLEIEGNELIVNNEGEIPDDTLAVDGMIYSITGRYGHVNIAKDVRVTGVYNSAGQGTKEAEAEGASQVATVINIVVPRNLEGIICLALEEGTLRLSRVVDRQEEVMPQMDGTISETTENITEEGANASVESENTDAADVNVEVTLSSDMAKNVSEGSVVAE